MLKLHDELITELSNSLTAQNYNPVVVANHRLYARAFLDYLAECDIQVETVTPQQVDQYFGYAVQDFEIQYGRPPSARWHMLPRTAIAKLLRLAQGNWPPDAEMIGPDDEHRHEICREYEAWLREERGLASASIAALMWEARNFLRWQFDRAGAASLETLSIVDIDLYMDMRAPGLRRKSLADVAERLRSVVRHLHRTGRIPTDLTPHIIGPMLYAYEDVPSTLERSQIAAVLATTQEDRSPRGLRDYAILQLLATYGLREGEICRLRLDDVDWRAESLRIKPAQSRQFVAMAIENHWWYDLATIDPYDEQLKPFVDRLRAWSDPDADETYLMWRRCLPDLCMIARHLESYQRLFRKLPAVVAQEGDVSLRGHLRPAFSHVASRMGIEAAPLAKSLGIGANWLVRELGRKGVSGRAWLETCRSESDCPVVYLPSLGSH